MNQNFIIIMIKQFQAQNYVNSLNIGNSTKKSLKYLTISHDPSLNIDSFTGADIEQVNRLFSNRDKNRQKYFTINRKSEGKIQGCKIQLILRRFNSPQRNTERKKLCRAYRDSIDNKKDLQLASLFNSEQTKRKQTNDRQSQNINIKKLFFPINHSTKHRKNQNIQQTIIRKKIYTWASPYSLKNIINGTQNIEKQKKLAKSHLFNRNLIKKSIELSEIEKMRSQKLNYKPIIRVKRIATLNSIQSSSDEDLQQSAFLINQCKYLSKQSNSELRQRLKIKTESSEIIQKGKLDILYARKKDRYLKSKQRLNHIEKIDEWQHDHNEFGQDF